jgi:UDP-glucose 4-epimerase
LAGHGNVTTVPWPADRKKIDIGDVYSSYAKIETALGWRPQTDLREGLAKTLAYYQDHWRQYW